MSEAKSHAAIGSCWQHHSGAFYVVIGIGNDYPQPRQSYPPTVIYCHAQTGKLHTGPLDDWNRRMKPVDPKPDFFQAAARELIRAATVLLDRSDMEIDGAK